MRRRSVVLLALLALITAVSTEAQAPPPFVGMGDSIGEGVQSADASWVTQPNIYLNWIAHQMGVPFSLPLIAGSPFSSIFSVKGRARIFPNMPALNLAVSGAKTGDLLNAVPMKPIATEADLVLEPRTTTQIQTAQALQAPFTVCWVGNDDALDAVLNWNHLDGTPLTSVATFTAEWAQLVSQLTSWGGKAVVATIPDLTSIGFVFGPQDLVTWLGSDFGLPQGSYTTLPTMLLIKLGLNNGSLLQNPNYVLDANEYALIQTRVNDFNNIIRNDAAGAGIAVADIAVAYQQLIQNPPVFHGVAITPRYNAGLLSLDGVHPSNIGHALAANIFIPAANQKFNMNIPLLTQQQLTQVADGDPFIDWNGDLKVRGRPFAGLLETLGPVLGISGDLNDHPGSSPAAPVSKIDKAAGQAFMQQYLALKGLPADTPWGPDDAINAMKEVFHFWLR